MPDGAVFHYNYGTRGSIESVQSPTGELRQYSPAFAALALDAGTGSETSPNTISPAVSVASSKVDGRGGVSEYGFDVRGHLLWEADPLGNARLYKRDKEGRVLWSQDAAGLTTTMVYNQYGLPAQQRDSVRGVTERLSFDGKTDKPFKREDALGHTMRFTYDAKGNLTAVTHPDSGVTHYSYNDKGLLTQVTDPLGHIISYEYDTQGNLAKTSDPLGHTVTYQHDGAGNVTSVTDPNGNTTTFTYDLMNRKTSQTDPYGNTTTYAWVCSGTNASGCGCCSGDAAKLAAVTDPLGNTTTFDYNGVGNLIKQTDPLGHFRTMAYDMNRNLASITDEDGRTTSFEYDDTNRQTAIVAPGGARSSTQYDSMGRVVSQTDPLSRVNRYEYDLAGRLTAQVDALNGRTSFTYDAVGNRLSVTDANGHTTTFTYDAMKRQLSETDPLNRVSSTAYDAAGRVASTTDVNGQTIIYNYDNANRLTSKKYPDNSIETYTYDNNGNLLSSVNSAVSMSYTYDKRNLLLTIKNETIDKTVSYTYDANGRKASLTYPDGETISYARDHRSQVSTFSTSQPGTLTNPIVTYAYNPSGTLSTMDYSLGMHVARAYNPQTRRLIDIKYTKPDNSVLSDFAYTYDVAGNILTKTNDFGNITYVYDSLNRLTSAEYSWKPTETFTYDAVGNRLSSADYNNWQYDAADQLLNYGNNTNPSFTFTYDANGSTTSKTDSSTNLTTQYLYNFDKRIIEVQQGGSTIAKYFYDHQSQRVRKDLYTGDILSSSIWFIYGQEGILAEYDNNGQLIKKITWQPNDSLNNEPLSVTNTTSNHFFYICDHLSSPQKIVADDFSIMWQGDLKAFGVCDLVVNIIENNLRLPGQYADQESTLLYNYFRFYQPKEGRYWEVDPLKTSKYSYCSNNSIRYYDYLGLEKECKKISDWEPSPVVDSPDNKGKYIGSWITDFYKIFHEEYGQSAGFRFFPSHPLPYLKLPGLVRWTCYYHWWKTERADEYEKEFLYEAKFECTDKCKTWVETQYQNILERYKIIYANYPSLVPNVLITVAGGGGCPPIHTVSIGSGY